MGAKIIIILLYNSYPAMFNIGKKVLGDWLKSDDSSKLNRIIVVQFIVQVNMSM